MAETYQRPGWYPDPDGKPGERWWNGSTWSDSRRDGAGVAVPPVAAQVQSTTTPPPTPPVIYSASNPAPQRPDPYARTAAAAISSRAGVLALDARANRNAVIGVVTGFIALFFFGILGPVSIVFSAMGIAKARQLKAQGATNTLMVTALLGLATGILATIIAAVSFVVFLVSIVSFSVS